MAYRNIVVSIILVVLVTDYLGDTTADKITISSTIKRLLGYPEENLLDFAEQAKAKGYTAETHYVTTEDGYVLKNFRIKKPYCFSYQKVPVLLLHGVVQNSDSFLVAGKDAALGYFLADQCYDVWAINYRGNNYSRNHTTLDPDNDSTFWDYSMDEVYNYDNVAVIDNILEKTGAKKVNVIGFSMGGGTILVTLAGNPEYNEKIGVVIGLAPGVTLRKTKSVGLAILMKVCYEMQDYLSKVGVKEILTKDSLVQSGMELLCQFSLMKSICDDIISMIDCAHSDSLSAATVRRYFSTLPMGIGVRFAAHGQQWVQTEELAPAKYDYGTEENLVVYGSETPPAYDFSNISSKVVIFHGVGDHIVTSEAVTELVALLPNVTFINVGDSLWNHFDMLYSQNCPSLILKPVLSYLQEYNN